MDRAELLVDLAEEMIMKIKGSPIPVIPMADLRRTYSQHYDAKDVDLTLRRLIIGGVLRDTMIGVVLVKEEIDFDKLKDLFKEFGTDYSRDSFLKTSSQSLTSPSIETATKTTALQTWWKYVSSGGRLGKLIIWVATIVTIITGLIVIYDWWKK